MFLTHECDNSKIVAEALSIFPSSWVNSSLLVYLSQTSASFKIRDQDVEAGRFWGQMSHYLLLKIPSKKLEVADQNVLNDATILGQKTSILKLLHLDLHKLRWLQLLWADLKNYH